MKLQGLDWAVGGQSHAYDIGTNSGPEFVLGNVGSRDDFWLHGAPVPDFVPHPLITGSILGSDGQPLIKLVLGKVTYNPGHCRQVVSTNDEGLSYQIKDSVGNVVLQADTIFSHPKDKLVTSITGRFFDRNGELAFDANRGCLEIIDPSRSQARVSSKDYGLAYSETQRDFLMTMLATDGAINYMLDGEFDEKEIEIDGAYLTSFKASNCNFKISTGFWAGRYTLLDVSNTFELEGMAKHLGDLIGASKRLNA